MRILTHRLFYIIFFSVSTALGQVDTSGDDIVNDLVYLAGEYTFPAAEAAAYQSSGGWYTSAKKKELWDLEFSVQGNLLFIPNKRKNFVIDEAKLTNLSIQGSATTASTPTALGGDNFVVLEGNFNGNNFEFDSPEGVDETFVKHAQIQAALGLWGGTTFIARYSPKIKINKTYYQILGFGLQHNLSQWIPKIEESSFDISGLVTYSFYSVSDNFSEVDLLIGKLNSVIVDGQSFMFNLIASKQINKFNFSTGLGLTSSKFEFEVGGEGDQILGLLNDRLGALNESKTNFKADLGIDYRFGDFSVNSMLTVGNFTNLILGLNYNL